MHDPESLAKLQSGAYVLSEPEYLRLIHVIVDGVFEKRRDFFHSYEDIPAKAVFFLEYLVVLIAYDVAVSLELLKKFKFLCRVLEDIAEICFCFLTR